MFEFQTSSNSQVTRSCVTVSCTDTENTPPTNHSVAVPTLGVKTNLLHRLNSADESRLDVKAQTGSIIQLQTGNAIVVTENQNQPTIIPINASTFTPITSQTTVISQSMPVSVAASVSVSPSVVTSSNATVAFVVPSAVLRPSDVGLTPALQVAGVGIDPSCKKIRLDPSAIRIMRLVLDMGYQTCRRVDGYCVVALQG